jgi:hypothetical protein
MKKLTSGVFALIGCGLFFGAVGGVECGTLGLLAGVPVIISGLVLCELGLSGLGAFRA